MPGFNTDTNQESRRLQKKKLIKVIVIALALNAVIFAFAFPQAFQVPKTETYARDFSAYYRGEWRLFHNPTEVYYGGVEPGDIQITPLAQTFKYTPTFLILFAPFLALNYSSALAVFDVLQFALIPVLAFFVYKLVKDKKNLVVAAVASVVVLVDPLPSILLMYSSGNLKLAVENVSLQLSPGYFDGYMLGNAHILQTVLLVGALYMGFAKKPWASALLFTFGALDPRGALLALPLLLWYNRHSLVKFIGGTAIFLAVTNVPFFFYHGVGFDFLRAEVNGNIATQLYPYDWIPIYSIAALTIAEIINSAHIQGKSFFFSRKVENSPKI